MIKKVWIMYDSKSVNNVWLKKCEVWLKKCE